MIAYQHETLRRTLDFFYIPVIYMHIYTILYIIYINYILYLYVYIYIIYIYIYYIYIYMYMYE